MKTLLIALMAMLAMGCSSNSTNEEAVKQSVECADVWVVGSVLPADYASCDNNGVEEQAVWVECKDGSRFTTFNDEYHARAGKEISNTNYDKAYWKCMG